MKTKKLYTEQSEAVSMLLDATDTRPWRVVVMPTGAGKTAVLQAAATLAAKQGKRVVIGTPLQSIRSALTATDTFEYEGQVVSTQHVTWHVARTGSALAAALDAWKDDAAPGGVLVATHQLLVQHLTRFPESMREWVVVLDEGHHAGENYDLDNGLADGTNLYRLALACYERGGQVWSATATAFRSDGRRIATADVASYTVRYSDLALQDLLPRNVRVRTILCPDASSLTLSDGTLASIAKYIVEVGRPTVVRLPPGSASSGSVSTTAERVVQALVAAGSKADRILNVVGNGTEIGDALQDALDAERERAAQGGYSARKYDVIVSCGRMREGADWPYCSHVVLVGIPTSLTTAVQTAGRGSRNKHRIKSYPAAWRNDVLVSAFIPGTELDVIEQAQRALLLAAAIECDETTLDYRRFWKSITKGFRLPPVVRGARTADALAALEGDVEERAVAVATVLAARADFAETVGRDPSPAELWEKLDRWGSTSERKVRRSLLAQVVVQDTNDPGLRDALGGAYKAALESTTGPNLEAWSGAFEDTLGTAFAKLAAQYTSLSVSRRVSGLATVEAALTPAVMRAATRALAAERNAALAYSDEEIVRALPDPRSFPHTGQDAPLSHYFGRRTYATDLRGHLRRTGFDLDRLRLCVLWHTQKVCEHPVTGPALDPAQVRSALERHYKARRTVFRKLAEVGSTARAAEAASLSDRAYRLPICDRTEHLIGLWWAAQRGWRGLTPAVFADLD